MAKTGVESHVGRQRASLSPPLVHAAAERRLGQV